MPYPQPLALFLRLPKFTLENFPSLDDEVEHSEGRQSDPEAEGAPHLNNEIEGTIILSAVWILVNPLSIPHAQKVLSNIEILLTMTKNMNKTSWIYNIYMRWNMGSW